MCVLKTSTDLVMGESNAVCVKDLYITDLAMSLWTQCDQMVHLQTCQFARAVFSSNQPRPCFLLWEEKKTKQPVTQVGVRSTLDSCTGNNSSSHGSSDAPKRLFIKGVELSLFSPLADLPCLRSSRSNYKASTIYYLLLFLHFHLKPI